MNKQRFLLSILALACASLSVYGDGSEVVVVYNKNVAGSKMVADYYVKMRHVPAKQVYGFDLTMNEVMTRAEFRDRLQRPLAKKLEGDGLWKLAKISVPQTNGPEREIHRVVSSKIRYAVLCYGIPLTIAEDSTLSEPIPSGVPQLFLRNSAAVDSELTLLPMLDLDLPLVGPRQNWVYGATNSAVLGPTNGILLVSRLDGPTAEIARGLVDKALQAEQDGLWGRAYFDARGLTMADSNYLAGDQLILGAAQLSRILGYETVIDDKPSTFRRDFPMSQVALYAGWYDENVSGPFRLPRVEFVPGAFAYHLHSFSAATIRSDTNRWVGPFLARGVTCTMGTVDEPSLQFTPNIALFLQRWSINQFTFAEAAWSSQLAVSWQTTVVGDPLYRPFGKLPEQLQAELAQRHSPLVEWAVLRIVNGSAMRGAPNDQLISSLEHSPLTGTSAVLTEKLATLSDAGGRPSAALAYYQQALDLNPSPQQRIRIRFALADKYLADGKKKEAYDDLRKILDENPDYRDKFEILKRLLDLAIALVDKDEIVRCTREMQENPPQAD